MVNFNVRENVRKLPSIIRKSFHEKTQRNPKKTHCTKTRTKKKRNHSEYINHLARKQTSTQMKNIPPLSLPSRPFPTLIY